MRLAMGLIARLAGAVLAIGLCLSAPVAYAGGVGSGGAGSGSGGGANPRLSFPDAAAFAKAMEKDLAAKGARLAIVFRTGETRDKLPEGIRYTHGAFWVHTEIQTIDGRTLQGYAVYNLFHGDGKTLPMNRSYLHQDFPVDFVSGTAVDDLGVIIPSPEMQRRILAVMESPRYTAVHVPNYSLVSHPHDPQLQNCNEFMLDVIAAALWDTDNYAQIKANLKANFRPEEIKVGLLERMFGPMLESRISTADQSGEIETVTDASIARFLRDNRLLQETYVFDRPKPPVG
jgi:hypothetical protein